MTGSGLLAPRAWSLPMRFHDAFIPALDTVVIGLAVRFATPRKVTERPVADLQGTALRQCVLVCLVALGVIGPGLGTICLICLRRHCYWLKPALVRDLNQHISDDSRVAVS